MKTKLVCLLFAFTVFQLLHAQDNSIKQRTITVTGSAETELVPDQIDVQVNLREYTKKGAGKISLETIRNNFLASCKKIGLSEKEISVQNYQGSNNYWWYKKQKKQNPDMNAGISYTVRLHQSSEIEELVNILDDEATENFFIADVSSSKIQEIKKQLKIDAVKASKEKASYLAEAIGEKLGEAITINDPSDLTSNFPVPAYANRLMKMEEDKESAPMNIDFKKIKLAFSVTVIYALK